MLEKLNHPRSYLVLTHYGTKLRRNRRHLLLTKKANRTKRDFHTPEMQNDGDNSSDYSFSLLSDDVHSIPS